MSNVPEKELQQNLDSILTRAQTERIVISRRGKPCAVLVGIEDYDAEDLKLASSEEFWRMITLRRAGGKSLPLAEVEARLGITRREAGRQAYINQAAAKVLVSASRVSDQAIGSGQVNFLNICLSYQVSPMTRWRRKQSQAGKLSSARS